MSALTPPKSIKVSKVAKHTYQVLKHLNRGHWKIHFGKLRFWKLSKFTIHAYVCVCVFFNFFLLYGKLKNHYTLCYLNCQNQFIFQSWVSE